MGFNWMGFNWEEMCVTKGQRIVMMEGTVQRNGKKRC